MCGIEVIVWVVGWFDGNLMMLSSGRRSGGRRLAMGTTEITCGVTAPAGGRARVEGEMTQTTSATSRNLLVQLNIEFATPILKHCAAIVAAQIAILYFGVLSCLATNLDVASVLLRP